MSKPLSYIYLGCTSFSAALLQDLLENHLKPKAIFSIPEEFNISYSEEKVKNSNYFNFEEFASENDIPYREVESVPGKKLHDYSKLIEELNPDVILVMGWYYMVPEKVRELALHGAWGIHASLLPNYAGGAPLVWAIINGEDKAGVSLFKLGSGVDDGPIIAQKEFEIGLEDHIKDVYLKATVESKKILREALMNPDHIKYTEQDKNAIVVYPQRSPKDGEIDWGKSQSEIQNFIRAQSRPYPGAYFMVGNKKVTIWDATINEIDNE
jgi:methionyl-tRNA formyltransferase